MIPARGLAREQVVLVAAPAPAPATATIDVPQAKEAPAPASTTTPGALPKMSTISAHPEPALAAGGWSNRTKVGAGLTAGGAASLALGIAYQVVREQRAGAFNDHHCGVSGSVVTGPSASDCTSRHDDIQSAQKIAIAGFVGAAVLGGVGTYLILSGGSGAGDALTARASTRLRCVPAPGLGVVCAARF